MACNKLIGVSGLAPALLFTVLLSVSACREAVNKEIIEDAKKIARMKCTSRNLTEQKFRLASRYASVEQLEAENRTAPDSLSTVKEKLDKEKAVLIQQSQESSDELLVFLRGVWQKKYTTQAERASLDSITEIELRKICTMP